MLRHRSETESSVQFFEVRSDARSLLSVTSSCPSNHSSCKFLVNSINAILT